MGVNALNWADLVVACMDGPDPDSGTAWECGYAYAKGKPVVCYRTDFRITGDTEGAPYNLMLSESAAARVEIPFRTRPEEFRRRLRDCIGTALARRSWEGSRDFGKKLKNPHSSCVGQAQGLTRASMLNSRL